MNDPYSFVEEDDEEGREEGGEEEQRTPFDKTISKLVWPIAFVTEYLLGDFDNPFPIKKKTKVTKRTYRLVSQSK